MRIAISTDLYAPMINGVAVFSQNLARGLATRGHQVLVLAPSLTGSPHSRTTSGVKVARLSSTKIPLYPDQIKKDDKVLGFYHKNGIHLSLTPYKEIRTTLDKFHPDLIHNQTPGPIALAAYKYSRRRHIPIVATGHAYPDNLTSQLKYLKLIKKPTDAVVRQYFLGFLKNADYGTVPTRLAMNDLIPKRGIKTPVEPLSNGIDLSRFKPQPAPATIYAKYHIPQGRPIVGYVGRVDPEKSLDILLKSFAITSAKVPTALLVIVGDGTDLPRLQRLAANLGISDNTLFLGKIIGDDLPIVYRTFDIFAITSETETQSIVLMEALATGLPAVAVRAGAISELVKTGRNGFLCQPGDTTAIARGLTKLLRDPTLRTTYGTESLDIIKTHDLHHTLTRFEQIYNSVLRNS